MRNTESLEPISIFKSMNINEAELKSRYELNPTDLYLSTDKREFKSKGSRNYQLILYSLNLIELQEFTLFVSHLFTYIYLRVDRVILLDIWCKLMWKMNSRSVGWWSSIQRIRFSYMDLRKLHHYFSRNNFGRAFWNYFTLFFD